MKRTFLDKAIGFFSPSAELNRIRERIRIEAYFRAYDVSKTFPQSDWTSTSGNSANADTKAAIAPGRNKARSLAQNNPYSLKATNVVVNETVGFGIVPNITGTKKGQVKRVKELWNQWGNTPLCDFDGRNNFSGLQRLALKATVIDGESLALKRATEKAICLKIIEADFIATDKDLGKVYQGIELDDQGKKKKYHIYKAHPGERDATTQTQEIDPFNLIHLFRQERPGQLRGVTWAHAVVEKLKDFDDMQYATLVARKVQACFAGVITTNASEAVIDPATLKLKRQAEMELQPNTWKYLSPGEDVKSLTPPPVDGYADFNRETLRAIANGYGISYESLSGDYSQSNYSASRMGHLQMRKNIEEWRWQMLIPQFCEPAFGWFLEWASAKGAGSLEELKKNIKVEWVPPAYSMIDPTKEISSLQTEVRAGFKSYKTAVLELGLDPEKVLAEIAEYNQKVDELKIVLDSDPRRVSQQGQAQSSDPLTPPKPEDKSGDEKETDDKEDVTEKSDSGDSQQLYF